MSVRGDEKAVDSSLSATLKQKAEKPGGPGVPSSGSSGSSGGA